MISTGLLITFVQFLLTGLLTWPYHFSAKSPTLLKPTAVPLARLMLNAAMFFAVNLLNNLAFGYQISVPVHIILRSGGSALTMLVGYISGKRYTRVQVCSIAMVTAGVIVAALSDAQSKVRHQSPSTQIFADQYEGQVYVCWFSCARRPRILDRSLHSFCSPAARCCHGVLHAADIR